MHSHFSATFRNPYRTVSPFGVHRGSARGDGVGCYLAMGCAFFKSLRYDPWFANVTECSTAPMPPEKIKRLFAGLQAG